MNEYTSLSILSIYMKYAESYIQVRVGNHDKVILSCDGLLANVLMHSKLSNIIIAKIKVVFIIFFNLYLVFIFRQNKVINVFIAILIFRQENQNSS